MARRRAPSVSRTITLDGGAIYVRRMPQGVWQISFEFDKQLYPQAKSGIVDHIPPTAHADNLEAVISWARDEWGSRKGPAQQA